MMHGVDITGSASSGLHKLIANETTRIDVATCYRLMYVFGTTDLNDILGDVPGLPRTNELPGAPPPEGRPGRRRMGTFPVCSRPCRSNRQRPSTAVASPLGRRRPCS